MRIRVLCFKENPVMPLRQSKSLLNKQWDSYYPTVTVLFLNCYCLNSPQSFTISGVIELRFKQISVVGKLRQEATSSIFMENPVMPLRQSKSVINKHLDCYCPTVTVSFWNCYCLTSTLSFNHIWSYRTPIQEKLVTLES